MMRDIVVAVVLMAAMSLTACSRPAGYAASWPIETYPYGCGDMKHITANSPLIKGAPICATGISLDEGFTYQDEFEACKQSMKNYFDYLDRMAQCKIEDTKMIVEAIRKDFLAYQECKQQSVAICDSEQVKQAYLEASIVKISLWFPSFECEQKNGSYLDSCIAELADDFQELAKGHIDARDRFLRAVEADADETVRLFNCKANREKFCF
ncbi:hypothetical protein ABIE64_000790 [Thalassospira sp. MBR-102]|uniref:hypothetical protein n=1 Tax=Thalassospira sp. MBR-102 TaxID=3156466 RepID=UPI0033970F4A